MFKTHNTSLLGSETATVKGSVGGDTITKGFSKNRHGGIDLELRRQQAKACNAKQMADKKKAGMNMDPWMCFIQRKIKNPYPWQDFNKQDHIIPTPTRQLRDTSHP